MRCQQAVGGTIRIVAALVLFFCYFAGAIAQSPEEISSGKFCANCHANALLVWAGKHGTKADSRAPISVGCAMCHGDASEHVKSPANPMPRRFSKMASAEKNEVCSTCHQGSSRTHWPSSAHARNDVSCSSCHKVHAAHDAPRDKLTQADVCFSCHKDLRVLVNRPSRHPVREGMVACSDCHNPHGSVGPSMVRRDNVNDTCYTCHMEKRGPFVRTHQPVQENCAICHNPHGTTTPNLLRARPPFLCQSCHEPTSHRGNVASLTAAPGTSANTIARGCLNCHTQIHGTNNPSNESGNRTFRR
jgi:DmsE family decaheme c-type cytochrome